MKKFNKKKLAIIIGLILVLIITLALTYKRDISWYLTSSRASIYLEDKDYSKAEKLYVKAFLDAINLNKIQYIAVSLEDLYGLYSKTNKKERFNLTLSVLWESYDKKQSSFDFYDKLANVFYFDNKPEIAQLILEHRLALIIKNGLFGKDYKLTDSTLMSLGYTYIKTKKYNDAIYILETELSFQKFSKSDVSQIARTMGTISEVYFLQGKYLKAKYYVSKAIQILESSKSKDKVLLLKLQNLLKNLDTKQIKG
jgi:tetratricopeptide (TPR) repeat protein